MSTPTQPDLPEIELTPEYVGGLLRVLRTLKNPPPLPDRKDDLWQNTVDRAKAELQEEARERAEQRIGRPRARGKRTTAQEKHKLGQQFDRAVQARARRIYRNLDPIRAEAEQKIKDTFDEKLAEFARLCARVRNALTQRSKLKERDLWVYGPLPVFDYGEYWWLTQNDWQRNWQKRLPKTIHDLELIRQVLVHRAGVSEAEAGAKSEAEARVGGRVNGSDEVAKKSREERPSSGTSGSDTRQADSQARSPDPQQPTARNTHEWEAADGPKSQIEALMRTGYRLLRANVQDPGRYSGEIADAAAMGEYEKINSLFQQAEDSYREALVSIHEEFGAWVDAVYDWYKKYHLDQVTCARWVTLSYSPFVVGGRVNRNDEAWLAFRAAVQARLEVLAVLAEKLKGAALAADRDEAPAARPDAPAVGKRVANVDLDPLIRAEGTGKRTALTVTDKWGERTLIVPETEPAWAGDPTRIVLQIEALTGTRLKEGQDPCRFIRLYKRDYKKNRDPAASVSFADFVARLHPDWIDVVSVKSGQTDETGAVEESQATVHGEQSKARIWDKDYCPVCAKVGLKWVSHAEFERRTKKDGDTVKRETASARIKDGRYLADSTGQLPWCALCKGGTPKGTGEREPEVDERQSASEDQTRIYGEQCAACAAELLKLSKAPSLEVPVIREKGKLMDIARVDTARDAARNAVTTVLAEHRARGRELTRDEVEGIARPEIESFVRDQKAIEASSRGSGDDVQNAISASKDPRPEGQRRAPHKGEDSRSYSGE